MAVGEDFRHGDASEIYLALTCRECGLVYLSPRPVAGPKGDHGDTTALSAAFGANGGDVGARASAVALRLVAADLPADAAILCIAPLGDPGVVELARTAETTRPQWRLSTFTLDDEDEAAVLDRLEHDLPRAHFDLVLLHHALERQPSPCAFAQQVRTLVRPGGRIAIVTPNTHSASFGLFGGRHWAGYDFPRHVALFGPRQIQRLAQETRMELTSVATVTGVDLWLRSTHQFLTDWGAPEWLCSRVGPRAHVAPAVLSGVESFAQRAGRGGWMIAVLRRPQ
jgi:SAM-dependent methyltransferase